MITRIKIINSKCTEALALAPLSVSSLFERQGVGRELLKIAHERARLLRFPFVIVVGITGYYEKFGYVWLYRYPIKLPFEVASEHCFVRGLRDRGLVGPEGIVEDADEWMERS